MSVEDEDKAMEIMQKVYDKTNKHYRRFYEDELENDVEIFAKNPFLSYPIMRGQSRGVEKSWFSFGAQAEDESGEATTEREIGKFKGTIEIVNSEQKEKFEKEKEAKLQGIFSTLSSIFHGKTGTKKEFSLDCVATSEDKAMLMEDLKRCDLRGTSLIPFLEDLAFAGMIKEMLTRKTDAVVHLYLI